MRWVSIRRFHNQDTSSGLGLGVSLPVVHGQQELWSRPHWESWMVKIWELIKRDKVLPGRHSCQIHCILGNSFRLYHIVIVERDQGVLPDLISDIGLQLFPFFLRTDMVINYLLNTRLNTGQRDYEVFIDEKPQYNGKWSYIYDVIGLCFSRLFCSTVQRPLVLGDLSS